MKDVVISLFDVSGTMVQPWLEDGYECWIVDIQHPPAYDNGGITSDGRLNRVHADLMRPWLPPVDRERIAFVSAFPPCDHLAVSGARWFKGKGLRKLQESIAMFATAAEFCEWSKAPYIIENPRSNISSHWRKSDTSFQPYEYTGFCIDDNYTKDTCIWLGNGAVMPDKNINRYVEDAIRLVIKEFGRMLPKRDALKRLKSDSDRSFCDKWYPDNRIHECPPGPNRHNIRSATPVGFSIALHAANAPHLKTAA